MLPGRIAEALRLVAEEEMQSTYSPTKEKDRAIKEASQMFTHKGKTLDLGGCGYSNLLLSKLGFEVVQLSLHSGKDMHEMTETDEYDCIFCRHTLEHSPFPLYMALTIRDALKKGGEAVIVVPQPETDWVMEHRAHVSVLHREQWRKIFTLAGLTIIDEEPGIWTVGKHVEHRFLLRK